MTKFILEKHTYAPELNKIHFSNGVTMKTPNCTTIKEVKKTYFSKPKAYQLFGGGVFEYGLDKYKHLNRRYFGRVDSYLEVLNFVKKESERMLPSDFNGELTQPKALAKAFKIWA